MARVIKIDKKIEKKITHKECGAVIGYFENEVVKKSIKDLGGGSDTYNHPVGASDYLVVTANQKTDDNYYNLQLDGRTSF